VGGTFLDETVVSAAGGGRYEGEIAEAWCLRPLPQGGVVSAIALRALAAELDDAHQRLRTLHTTFAAQVTAGPVEVDVEVLRRGRSVSHLRGELRNPGAARGHLTTGIFGGSREGFAFTDLQPPVVPPPDDCPSYRDPLPPEAEAFLDPDEPPPPPFPFWETRLEGRHALGHPFWEDYVPDRAERASWLRFDDPPMLQDGTLDPLALVVMADVMPGAVGEKVGRTDRMWFAPSIDLTVHLLDDCRSPWVLAHNQARHAGDGYASADMALWDCGPDGTSAPRLVAYATQLFLFSFMGP
jgi:acyl-CoA thioesterase